MTKYKMFKAYWEAFSIAIEENEIELQNALLIRIEELLPFESDQEKTKWYYITETYKFWEDFEEITFEIAKRLKGVKYNGII